jgi:hypothetical protein
MIRVVHYDHERFFSHRVREKLVTALEIYPEVDYLDYWTGSEIFDVVKEDLEKILPDYNVLLIRPGTAGQSAVFRYPARFPKLRIAFVIGGEVGAYHEENGITLIDGYRTNDIVNFILNKPMQSKTTNRGL